MSTRNIAVYVNGLDNGFNTPGGTEAQYIYGLVKMMAMYGYKVDCYGENQPSWGNDKPLPGVRLLSFHDIVSGGLEYDAHFNLPRGDDIRPHCTITPIKAKRHFHCHFSVTDKLLERAPVKCWEEPHNHYIVVPWDIPQKTTNEKVRYIPFPYYLELDKVEWTDRKALFWAARNPFGDNVEEDEPMAIQGAKLIKAMAKISAEWDTPCYFFNAKSLKTERAKRLGVTEAFNSIKNKTVYDELVTKDIVIEAFKKSLVNLVPPDQSGSCIDGIVNGCLPLFFETNPPFANYCEEGFHYLRTMISEEFFLTEDMSVDTIILMLIALYTPNGLAPSLVELAQQGLSWHSYENAYKYLHEALNETPLS